MSGFSATEAKLFLDAVFVFVQGELRDFDSVDDHGVGVMGFGTRGVGEGVVDLVGGLRVSFGDVISSFPLGLEGDGLLVPFIDGGRDGVHGHDLVHEWWWNSCGEVSDQDIHIGDVGEGYVVFEGGDILCQRGGVRVVFLTLFHMLGR